MAKNVDVPVAGSVEIPSHFQQELIELSARIDREGQLFNKASAVRLEHKNAIEAAHSRVDEILREVRGEPLLNQADDESNLPMGDTVNADAEEPSDCLLEWTGDSDEHGDVLIAKSILYDDDASAPLEYRIRPHNDDQFSIAGSSGQLIQGEDRQVFGSLEIAKQACQKIETGLRVDDPNLEDEEDQTDHGDG